MLPIFLAQLQDKSTKGDYDDGLDAIHQCIDGENTDNNFKLLDPRLTPKEVSYVTMTTVVFN